MTRSDIRGLTQLVAHRVLPYPDPVRRRRMRKLARDLVNCEPWPGNDATSLQIAQLAMLRLLWLERMTRRAATLQQRDATALLARSAVETCISSMYWLQTEDATSRLTGDNAKSLRKMLKAGFGSSPLRRNPSRHSQASSAPLKASLHSSTCRRTRRTNS